MKMILSYTDIGLVHLGLPKTLCRKNLRHLQKHLEDLVKNIDVKKDVAYEELRPMINGLTPSTENTELVKLGYLVVVAGTYGGSIPERKIKNLLPMVPEGLIVPAGKYYSIKNLGYKKYLRNLVEKWWGNLTK
jgi:hypothetical protein